MSRPNVFQRICINYHGKPKNVEARKVLMEISTNKHTYLYKIYKQKQDEKLTKRRILKTD